VERVGQLMREAGVTEEEIKLWAQKIFDAKEEFIRNAEFSIPVYKDKY
jgi:hypothetical protein